MAAMEISAASLSVKSGDPGEPALVPLAARPAPNGRGILDARASLRGCVTWLTNIHPRRGQDVVRPGVSSMQTKRIVILGPCGAGKSTLARRIGERLGLPVVHLDRFFWNPGWVQTEEATFRARVEKAAEGDAWVMDGNYTNPAPINHRLSRAHAVIWLDLPRHIYFPR